VIVVEREAMGGTNLHRGAIPARALAESARRAQAIRTAGAFGIAAEGMETQMARVRDHIAELTAALSQPVSAARYEAIGARLLKAEGVFLDRRTLSASGVLIRARRFVIATGSTAVAPEIAGLEAVEHFTEESIFGNLVLPGHLTVVGGGPFGLELAQAYRRLGSEVTLIDPAPLPDVDPELSDVVLRRLVEEGVAFRSAAVASVAPGIAIALADGGVVAATHLLVARARRPAIDGLDLDAAGLRRDFADPTRLAVRTNLTTSNSRIYAVGDAAGGSSAAFALHQARLVVESALFGSAIRSEPWALPVAVFTDPEIAQVGLTEATARAKFRSRFRVVRASFGENERARLGRRGHGLVKLIVGRDDCVLGAGIVGPEAAELVSLLAFAIGRKLKVRDLNGFFAPYPTLAQIVPALAVEDALGRPQNPVRAAWMALRRVLP
jgi:pyruvate/2-oxoglutarate dehydrogenase complex dihydrolipoamide dehydrogenase (E3) component